MNPPIQSKIHMMGEIPYWRDENRRRDIELMMQGQQDIWLGEMRFVYLLINLLTSSGLRVVALMNRRSSAKSISFQCARDHRINRCIGSGTNIVAIGESYEKIPKSNDAIMRRILYSQKNLISKTYSEEDATALAKILSRKRI